MDVTRKPRLLYFVEAMGGGVFTYIVDLANSLVDDYDVYIGYATRKQTPENYKDYFDKRVHLIKIENFSRSTSLIKAYKAAKEMKEVAKSIQPDVIHLHSSIAGTIGRLIFNGKKVPVFYTPHGYSFLMQGISSEKKWIYKLIEKICSKQNSTTVACSPGEYQATLELTKHATEVDNGINIKDLQSLIDSTAISNDKHYDVFTLGRISMQKNPKVFNEVASKLPDLKFLWIGDGELRSELTAPNITITGWVDRNQALKYAMQSDMFMLSSLWEGLPMSLLEAMYMKKLCLVSDVIGNKDVISNSINGYICKSPQEFVDKISSKRDKSYQHLIDSAYKDVLEHYNTKVVSKAYNNLYQAAINDNNKGKIRLFNEQN